METEGLSAETQQGKRRRGEPESGSQKAGDQKWVGQGAMDKLEGILGRMNLAQEEVDWEAEVHEVMAEEGAERLGNKLWYGDDMGPGTRGAETGCRIVVQNMQGKCGHHDGTMYRMLGAWAVPPGTYCQTPLCHLVKRPRSRGLLD